MAEAVYIFLFVFGTLIGSYINVLGLRYSPEAGFKLSNKGRSHCPYCGHTLRWYELIPLFSFLIQRGKCRICRHRLSLQYPVVEILSGLVFVFVPMKLGFGFPAMIWILAFLTFIVLSIIDFRFKVIPNKLNIFIAAIGFALIGFYYFFGGLGIFGEKVGGTSLGSYALIFQFSNGQIFINYAAGILFGIIFFGLLYFLSRGRAMGFGDVKLAAAIGVLMGWPDGAFALILSFVVGAIYGSTLLITHRKKMKDSIPFGPFIIIGVTLVFFFGYHMINGYFKLFNIY